MGVASQWLFNFVFTLTTPYMIKNIGWGTFLLWGLFDFVIAFFSWFVLTETKGKSLEEITISGLGDNVQTKGNGLGDEAEYVEAANK